MSSGISEMKLYKIMALARKKSGKTLRQIEAETGVQNGTISQIETGYSKSPEFFNVQKIARAIRLDWEDLKNAE
jgi:transcriptional regulator with XRE-family HTH domain